MGTTRKLPSQTCHSVPTVRSPYGALQPIDSGRSSCRQPAGREADDDEHDDRAEQSRWIGNPKRGLRALSDGGSGLSNPCS